MYKVKQSFKTRIQKVLLSVGIILLAETAQSQIYADFQVSGTNDSCIDCNIISPVNAVDGNPDTYSTLDLNVSAPGAEIYQTMNFSIDGNAGDYVGLAVEDSNFVLLDADALKGLELTTYYNGVSNNDTRNSLQFTITRINDIDPRYVVEFQSTTVFDGIELKLNSGYAGSSTNLMVFYAYHSVDPMPVNLLFFDASSNENKVVLSWATASEINNDHFTIERSADATNFVAIKKIAGAGNSTMRKDYTYTDEEPLAGTSYYRLKQTDHNGRTEYFKAVPVNSQTMETDLNIYPNPARGNDAHLNIRVSENTLLNIVSADGKTIFTENIPFDENARERKIDLQQEVKPGIYTLIISTDRTTRVKKWVVAN